jgi:hypothetical protein
MRKLGNSGLEVAPLALGGNVFGWTADEQASCKLLDAFVANGFNLVDTADMYSRWVPGHQGGESASSWPGNQTEGPDRPLFKGSRLRVVGFSGLARSLGVIHNGHIERCRGDKALNPRVEREHDLDVSISHFHRDTHGVVKARTSATFL